MGSGTVVGDQRALFDGPIGQNCGLVRDHQLMTSSARIDVKQAGEVVQVTLQEAGIRGQVFCSFRRYIDPLVSSTQMKDGAGRRALNVENVVFITQRQVKEFDIVIADAVILQRCGDAVGLLASSRQCACDGNLNWCA